MPEYVVDKRHNKRRETLILYRLAIHSWIKLIASLISVPSSSSSSTANFRANIGSPPTASGRFPVFANSSIRLNMYSHPFQWISKFRWSALCCGMFLTNSFIFAGLSASRFVSSVRFRFLISAVRPITHVVICLSRIRVKIRSSLLRICWNGFVLSSWIPTSPGNVTFPHSVLNQSSNIPV